MATKLRAEDLGPIDVALQLVSSDFVSRTHRSLRDAGVVRAITNNDSAPIFDWIVSLLPLQGISDSVAAKYMEAHGSICWADVREGLSAKFRCPRLRSWWSFECGFRKATRSCAEPDQLEFCALPSFDLRKGVLNEGAFGLYLFIQDVCQGDLVAWIDHQLETSNFGVDAFDWGRRLSAAVVQPLTNIPGTGPKLWSMILADLLLAGDPDRKLWQAAGASMVAIDSLCHNFFYRTGAMSRYGCAHEYGPACYGPSGCREVVEDMARILDARTIDPSFPAYFPRLLQVAIWEFCAEGHRGICNGRQIDDRHACRQVFCPAWTGCEKIALNPG